MAVIAMGLTVAGSVWFVILGKRYATAYYLGYSVMWINMRMLMKEFGSSPFSGSLAARREMQIFALSIAAKLHWPPVEPAAGSASLCYVIISAGVAKPSKVSSRLESMRVKK